MRLALDGRGAARFRGTGIGTYTWQLLANLVQLEAIQLTVFVAAGSDGLPPLPPTVRSVPVPAGPVETEDAWIAAYLHKHGPDIYHLPQNGLGLPVGFRGRLVVTVHDLIPYVLPETCSAHYRERFLRDLPRVVQAADRIIAVSQATRADLIALAGARPEQVTVVHEAAEPQYSPSPRRAAGSGPTPYLLYVGGFNRRKNLSLLVRAFSEALRELAEPLDLVLAGDPGPIGAALAREAEEAGVSGRLMLPGFIPLPRLPGLYREAVAFIYPSLYEGFGLPVLEAMACGTPVVAADLPALREVAGPAALWFDPKDLQGLSAAISSVVLDPGLRARLSAQGLARARQFSWERCARETAQVYGQAYALRPPLPGR